jgi:hypothetical protein
MASFGAISLPSATGGSVFLVAIMLAVHPALEFVSQNASGNVMPESITLLS